MAESPRDPDRNLSLLRDEINELRRDVLDIRDSTALPLRKSASQLAVQTTLAIIALVLIGITAALVLLNNGNVTSLQNSQRELLDEMRRGQGDLADRHAKAVLDLEKAIAARNDLARELASVKQELTETRLEARTGVVSDDRELAKLREKHNALLEKAAALEREVARADALSEQLKAVKEESELRIAELQATIRSLQEKIGQMDRMPALSSVPATSGSYASIEPGPIVSVSPTPTPTAPRKSVSSAIDNL